MGDEADVVDLVRRAGGGDRAAWDALVDRYAPLVWGICRRHRLSAADAEDVFQSVWLRLVERLRDIREPAALPGWLGTTAGRECLRVAQARWRERAEEDLHLENEPRNQQQDPVEQGVLAAELQQAMRTAFGQLPRRCQQLLSLLMEDPPVSYARISERLGMPIGGIGPNRARCLDRLRGCAVLAAYFGPVRNYGEGSEA
jgi:RNA polymerase sigma factor (sigma-70 family)